MFMCLGCLIQFTGEINYYNTFIQNVYLENYETPQPH